MNERDYEANERLRTVIDECEKILEDPHDPRGPRARYWLHRLLFEDPYRGYGASNMGAVRRGVFRSGGGMYMMQEMRYEGYASEAR